MMALTGSQRESGLQEGQTAAVLIEMRKTNWFVKPLSHLKMSGALSRRGACMKYLTILLGLLPALCPAAVERPEQCDIGIGGLWVYMGMEDVVEFKGPPSTHSGQADFITDILEYPDLVAEFNGPYLLAITSKTNTHCTFDGICPGAELSELEDIYGAPVLKDVDGEKFHLFISRYESRCFFEVRSTDSRIVSIRALCQP